MKYLFQQHFLFQIRIVGDIFISGDYIEEDVTDIQSYLNQTCKKWVNTKQWLILINLLLWDILRPSNM